MKPSPDRLACRGRHGFVEVVRWWKEQFQAAHGSGSYGAAGASLQHEVVVVEHQGFAIAASCQPGERLADALIAPGQRMIQFNDHNGVPLGQRAFGASQNVEIEAVDIDFQAVHAFDADAVR